MVTKFGNWKLKKGDMVTKLRNCCEGSSWLPSKGIVKGYYGYQVWVLL